MKQTIEIENKTTGILLVGVGGQGTILASNVLAELGANLGYDVKKAEVHGMSQRGGSVVSHVRWGSEVFSPIIAPGEVDILVAFEKLEALRYAGNLRPGGLVLVNDHDIAPITVSAGDAHYTDNKTIQAGLNHITPNIYWVNGGDIAGQLGNTKTANVVILGALSALLDTDAAPWLDVIEKRVPPKFIALNQKAFEAGRSAVTVIVAVD